MGPPLPGCSKGEIEVDLMGVIRKLATDIGPREAGSGSERQAATWIGEQLGELGLSVEEQPFRTVSTFSYTFIIIYVLASVSALALWRIHPALGLAGATLAAYLFWREVGTFDPLSRLLTGSRSQNVIARIPAAGETRHRVVITAHYDSSRSALLFHPALVGGFRNSLLIMGAAIFGSPFALLLGGVWPPVRWLAVIAGLYLVMPIVILFHRELRGRVTAGANDNASGVAVMLGVAADLVDRAAEHCEVWVVATGAEEAGTVGMARLLDQYGETLKSADFINIDNVGRGDLKYTVGEGVFLLHRPDPQLVETCHRVAIDLGVDAGPWYYRTLSTDATCALAREFRAISFMSFLPGGVLANWHWPTDTEHNIDPDNLAAARVLVTGVVRDLDEASVSDD